MKYKEDDFSRRVKEIRTKLGLMQKDFAKGLKITGASLSEVESGKYKPGYEFYVNISREYNVNLYYLLFGEGEMFHDPTAYFDKTSEDFSAKKSDLMKFLWYFRRSSIVQYSVMSQFRSLFLRDKDTIEKEVEEYRERTGEEAEAPE
jgi:transcriptional regulator with XRE-family HTH domain